MHAPDISNYEDKLIRSNKKVKSKRTFLSKELSSILHDGYRKSNIRPKRFIDNINFAIEQATKYFNDSLDDVIDDIGTNIHVMIQKMKFS
jgi:hypothetical protein